MERQPTNWYLRTSLSKRCFFQRLIAKLNPSSKFLEIVDEREKVM